MRNNLKINKFNFYLFTSILGLIVFSYFGQSFRFIGLLIIALTCFVYREPKNLFLIFSLTIIIPYKIKIIDGVYINPGIIFLMFSYIYLAITFLKNKGQINYYKFENNLSDVYKIIILYSLFVLYITIRTLTSSIEFSSLEVTVFMKIIKYYLYFTSFILAIYFGRDISEKEIKKYFDVFYWILIAFSGFSIIKVIYNMLILNNSIFDFYSRAFGVFGQYVDKQGIHIISGAGGSSGYIYVLLFFISILSISFINKSSKYYIGLSISSLALIFSRSRAAFLGMILGFVFIFIFKLNLIKKTKLIIIILLLFLSVFILSSDLIVEYSLYFFEKVMGTFSISDGELSFDTSAGGRVEYWSLIFNKVISTPEGFLFGSGWGDYINKYAGQHIVPHSLFIGVFGYAGIIGLIIMIILWIYIFKTLFKIEKIKDISLQNKIILYSLYGFWIGFLFNNLISGSSFFNDRISGVIWPLFGFLIITSDKYLKNKYLRS